MRTKSQTKGITMKTKMITLAALLTLSFSAAANEYFNTLDADNNGYIDLAEHMQGSKSWMDKADIKDEKRAQMNQNGFNKKDANKDGKITLEEFKAAKSKQKKNKNK